VTEFRLTRRRWIASAAGAGAVLLAGRPGAARQATPVASPVAANRDWQNEHWVGTWAAAPHQPAADIPEGMPFPNQLFELNDQTLRQVVRGTIGGEQARVRLANTFGEKPVFVGAAHIALRDGEERIDPATDHALTFSGLPVVTIPPGATVLSDPVDLSVPPLAELAVSLYFPESTSSSTVHGFAFQTNFISAPGDFTAAAALPVDTTMQTWVFLTGVDVLAAPATGAIVALGDSITDGVGSTPDTNHRWPDLLAGRLVDADLPFGVLNAGIGGNRLLHDSPTEFPFFGPSALARFDRDVLALPHVTHLIVFEGINDIGLATMVSDPSQEVTGDAIIAGLRQLAERAHERDIMAIGPTITPFEGAMYYSPAGEQKRQAVNDWIRQGGAFDEVLDFDAVTRDPDHPGQLLPSFDAGDHLHINDAGYQAMADSIDLAIFIAQ
jgi:lysophospholipase L1-like esterase